MDIKDYQKQAMTTCMATCDNFSYMFLNLVGELGEFASKIAKSIRKRDGVVDKNAFFHTSSVLKHTEFYAELRKEVGDILWQLSGLCDVMGWSLDDVAKENLQKLADRKERHVIDGDGDNR